MPVPTAPSAALGELARLRVLLLNWRDIRHPQSGGAEQYAHQIARRWAAAGVDVTWLTARPAGLPAREMIDGVRILRAGGDLSLYLRTAARILQSRGAFDVVVDCQNGIPFFSPLFARTEIPVVQVIHHVHQDQFDTRFPRLVASMGRFLEGPAARRVYGSRAIAAVSPSTRAEVRKRLGFTGPIHIVPNGSIHVPGLRSPRDPDPTIAVVSRLVPHKRVDLLLHHVRAVARRIPRLRVDIVGDGTELARLHGLITDMGLHGTVTLHGYQPDEVRDALLGRAWLTTSTSVAEGWGCSIIEAAAWGVPCAAIDAPGVRDAVIDGRTGRLVGAVTDYGEALAGMLVELSDDVRAGAYARACQAWASRFSWDRSAELLAGVVVSEARRGHDRSPANARRGADRRFARSDIGATAAFAGRAPAGLRAGLRATDEIVEVDGGVAVLLGGCDEADAAGVLRRLGVGAATIRLARAEDFLAGPGALPRLDDLFAGAQAYSP